MDDHGSKRWDEKFAKCWNSKHGHSHGLGRLEVPYDQALEPARGVTVGTNTSETSLLWNQLLVLILNKKSCFVSKRFVLLWQVTVQNFTITKLLFSSSGLLHAFACKCAGVGLKTVAWCSMLFFDVLRAFLVSFCRSVPPEFLLSFLASPDALKVMWVSD